MIKEINVICTGSEKYRFASDIIEHYDLDYNAEVIRIDFKDGSFIKFQKRNVICVGVNK